MKNRMKSISKLLILCLLTILLCGTVFAEEAADTPAPTAAEPLPTEAADTAVILPNNSAFSMAGNASLLDHFADRESGKEFFTIRTEAGQTFFMVVDYESPRQNVYILSMLDESSLTAFPFAGAAESTPSETESPAPKAVSSFIAILMRVFLAITIVCIIVLIGVKLYQRWTFHSHLHDDDDFDLYHHLHHESEHADPDADEDYDDEYDTDERESDEDDKDEDESIPSFLRRNGMFEDSDDEPSDSDDTEPF